MKSEAVVQSEIRAEAGRLGILLWRNNVGACTDETGRIIRYGLGNDSAQVQKRIKSSDLIGCHTVARSLAYEAPKPRAVFLAVECKAEGWKFPYVWRDMTPETVEASLAASADSARTLAQWRYLRLVHDAGALAGFAQSVDDFHRILQGELVLP